MVRSQSMARPRDNRWIAGVCAGLARRFGISPGMMRLLFLLSCLLPGPQFVAYLILWVIMPNEDRSHYRAAA
jgi:phage shock protein PspC (stress-responsive transcriptional regulator)